MINSQEKVLWIAPALVAAFLAPGWTARAETPPNEPPRLAVAGLEIGAVDLDRSAEFYSGVLGFKPVEGGRTPDSVRLVNGELELTLRKAGRPAAFDPEKVSHFYLNVEVNDLATTGGELEKRQLALGPRRETAIGYFASLRDPAGNAHQVVERKPHSLQPFPPRMFNIGIRIASMAAARDFYCRGLGFEVMGADHRPPIIPLKPRGATPLILFEGAATSAETGADTARAVLVLEVADLAAALDLLRQQGLAVTGQGEGFTMLADPSGNPVKLRQVRRAAAAGSFP